MKPKKRQKLCQNCEGEIDLDVIVCPFCAADLREEKPEKGRMQVQSNTTTSFNPTFESLYPSPHAPRTFEESAAPPAPEAKEEEGRPSYVFPLFLITLGVQLLLLGVLTLLFSHHGAVVLKWSAKFWFIYLFASLPLLVFGYKALK
ncbi:MAG: hypothetical protein HY069_01215 [Chlamydiia bacterium]|nr:hypothetical protein [Chlamydiia bacterium]